MPSSSAVFSALAAALVGLHNSGWLDRVPSPVAPEPPLERPCRLHADVSLGQVQEGLLAIALSPHAAIVVAAVLICACIGLLTILWCFLDCCCTARAPRSVHRVLSHGVDADRRIARR